MVYLDLAKLHPMKIFSRRTFLKASAVIGTTSLLDRSALANDRSALPSLKVNSRILFQGDSITDGGRSRDNDWNHLMGHGYAFIIASRLCFERPAMNYHFLNRGISGNTINDLTVRWKEDATDLSPDVISILIGVNDTNAEIDGKRGYTPQLYTSNYRNLLSETKLKLPHVKLVISEPFILPVGRVKTNWSRWLDAIAPRQEAAEVLAREFSAIYIPFQSYFNAALDNAAAEHWIWDGIHPLPAGHELMARKWISATNL